MISYFEQLNLFSITEIRFKVFIKKCWYTSIKYKHNKNQCMFTINYILLWFVLNNEAFKSSSNKTGYKYIQNLKILV